MEPPTQLTIACIHDKFEGDGTVHDVHKQKIFLCSFLKKWLLNMLWTSTLPEMHQFYGNEPFYFQQDGASAQATSIKP
jgi:hypothetical protein